MNLRFLLPSLAGLLLASTALAADPTPRAPAPALRRFAVIASANDGGTGRARLRYADSDARAVADVLQNLGGLAASDLVLVPGATRGSLSAAFARIKTGLAEASTARVRRELFVYYSGHSDEEGLLLGGERVPYRELRGLIDGAGADVRIAILDSCASGALIRHKGGTLRPGFLNDLSTDARGHAFLTASSEDEAAQESERIGAAFFTHFLVSGLRGAADTNRNGRVTLNEAYQFAYHETLRRTERTSAGPQHPTYDFQLAGTGDFVMTDVSSSGAALVLEENVAGRVYVRDRAGRLLVELRKEPLYPVELGLGPGEYQVSLDADGRPFEARVFLKDGRRARLGQKEFVAVETNLAMARGNAPVQAAVSGGEPTVAASAGTVGPYREIPFDLVLAPGVRTSGDDGRPIRNRFVLGVVGHSHELQGVQLSIGGNIVEHRMGGAQISVGFNLARGSARGAQMSGGANVVLGSFEGIQIGDFANVTLGGMKGAQLSMTNWSSGSLSGTQMGLFNHSGGVGRGAQLAVINSSAGHLEGLQAGVLNLGSGGIKGAQLGVVNYAATGGGAKVGVVNVAGSFDGLQLGVLNLGRKVRGFQLGVVNIAESVDGASFALLNLIGDGYHAVTAWSSDLLATNLGVKLGSRHLYTLLGAGIGRTEDDRARYGGSIGFGVHSGVFAQRLFIDVDAVGTHFAVEDNWTADNQTMASLRMTIGFYLWRSLAITAGPSYNVYVRKTDGFDHNPGIGAWKHVATHGDYQVSQFPGFLVGLQI